MLDVDAPSSRLAIAELEKPTVRERLHKIALWSTSSNAAAEDLVADALVRVLDPDDVPWIADKRTFLSHMTYVMRQTWDEAMRRCAAQREILDGGLAQDKTTASTEPPADDELHRRRSLAVWQSLLEEVVTTIEADHPLARPICELAAQGTDEAADQARALACPVEKIYSAIATLKWHARRAYDEWNRSEQRRMTSARASRKKEVAL